MAQEVIKKRRGRPRKDPNASKKTYKPRSKKPTIGLGNFDLDQSMPYFSNSDNRFCSESEFIIQWNPNKLKYGLFQIWKKNKHVLSVNSIDKSKLDAVLAWNYNATWVTIQEDGSSIGYNFNREKLINFLNEQNLI